jgi:2-(1,2-epoxy-1,2-dihydrophenyl)acetyl-CoA isomerase
MQDQYIIRSLSGAVLTVTMNRPEVLNSCNGPMVAELAEAFRAAAADHGVRAILLTGAGRAFCAGQDLAEAVPADGAPAPDIGRIVEAYNAFILSIRQVPKPVIAAVNGVAAGAGANIALACDIVLAADTASFIQAFIKIGLIPDNGGTFLLPRLVGLARATAAMMLGGKITAQQAKEWGMIHDVAPSGVLMDAAAALARQMADQPTRGLGLIKRALNASAANDLVQQLSLEAALQREAAQTDDYAEGVRAFQEKRAPRFLGR